MINIQKLLEENFGSIKNMRDKDLNLLLSSCHIETYKKNSIVWKHQNGNNRGVLILVDGILKARYYTETSAIFLYFLKKGNISMLAAPTLIGNINTHIELIAQNEVRLVRIEEEVYSKLETEYLELLLSTDYYLAKALEKLTLMIRKRLHASVEKNLTRYLVEQSDVYESSKINTTHQELADDIGTTREVVSRALYKLRDKGIIALARHQIEILNKQGLTLSS